MSKMFYKGRQDKRENYGSSGFATKRTTKQGTEEQPLSLSVKTEERKI